jgi:hypothetical protein
MRHDIKTPIRNPTRRLDVCCAALHTPGVTALLQAWDPEMQTLVREAAAVSSAVASSSADSPPASQQQQQQQQQQRRQRQLSLSFRSFFTILQDREAIPQLLQPADVEEALRRIRFDGRARQEGDLISDLTPSEFLETLALLGLSVFQTRRFKGTFSQPEQQLAAFFTHLGLPPLTAHDSLMAGGAPSTLHDKPAAAAGATAGRAVTASVTRQVPSDPYAEWWSMRFDLESAAVKRRSNAAACEATAAAGAGGGGGGVGGYRSSAVYNLVLLQVRLNESWALA